MGVYTLKRKPFQRIDRFDLFQVTMVDAEVGQYVLVHAGCAIEVMAEDKAEELLSLFGELDTI